MLVKGKRKVFGTEFRDYYRKATKNDKRKLDRTDNEKIIRLFIKKLVEKITINPSGVHIRRIGYFYVHMMPFNVLWGYKGKYVFKYHPCFIPTRNSIFKFWGMDFHFSRKLNADIQQRINDGYRYLNMIRGVSDVDYYYLGTHRYSWRQHKIIKRRNEI